MPHGSLHRTGRDIKHTFRVHPRLVLLEKTAVAIEGGRHSRRLLDALQRTAAAENQLSEQIASARKACGAERDTFRESVTLQFGDGIRHAYFPKRAAE